MGEHSTLTSCPDDNVIVALLEGELQEHETRTIQAHLDSCESCSELFQELMAVIESQPGPMMSDDGASAGVPALAPSSLIIGRYEVRSILGSGAMGVVYRAFDPDLQREVALKVLRPDRFQQESSRQEATERLLKEARALAGLNHPHVVTVYDVGTWKEGHIFIASELIEGETIHEWAKARSWQEIVSAYEQVARGLYVAHERGFVHRDVKPANILVRRGGHAYLMDFGLVQDQPRLMTSSQVDSSQLSLTMTGVILGTPVYMSPEQLDGQGLTSYSDQYSFCVSLYESIYGFRPFTGSNLAELSESRKRALSKPPSKEIPESIFRVLEKGLSPRIQERHASMETLADALSKSTTPTYKTPLLWTAGVTALITLLVLGVWSQQRGSRQESKELPDSASPTNTIALIEDMHAVQDDDVIDEVELIQEDMGFVLRVEDMGKDAHDVSTRELDVVDKPPVVVARQEERKDDVRSVSAGSSSKSVTPKKGPSLEQVYEKCLPSMDCDKIPDCLPMALQYIKYNEPRDNEELRNLYAVTVRAKTCAYKQRRCGDADALHWYEFREFAKPSTWSSTEYKRSHARVFGMKSPYCPLGTKHINTPELKVEQLLGALIALGAQGTAQSCKKVWDDLRPGYDALYKLDPQPENLKALAGQFEQLNTCLRRGECDTALKVWTEVLNLKPDAKYIKSHGVEESFYYKYSECVPPKGSDSQVQATWLRAKLNSIDYKKQGSCQDAYELVDQIWPALDLSVLDKSTLDALDSGLDDVTRCLVPTHCDRAKTTWSRRKGLGFKPNLFDDLEDAFAYRHWQCVEETSTSEHLALKVEGQLHAASMEVARKSDGESLRFLLDTWAQASDTLKLIKTKELDRKRQESLWGYVRNLAAYIAVKGDCDSGARIWADMKKMGFYTSPPSYVNQYGKSGRRLTFDEQRLREWAAHPGVCVPSVKEFKPYTVWLSRYLETHVRSVGLKKCQKQLSYVALDPRSWGQEADPYLKHKISYSLTILTGCLAEGGDCDDAKKVAGVIRALGDFGAYGDADTYTLVSSRLEESKCPLKFEK